MRKRKNGQFAKKSNSGKRFEKGLIPWNKGLKGIHLSKDTEFDGTLIGDKHPSWKGGIHRIKNDVVYLWTGSNERVRRPRKVYENNYGEIPKGYVVYHKDGNSLNDDPKNLEAISRGELMKRNHSINNK